MQVGISQAEGAGVPRARDSGHSGSAGAGWRCEGTEQQQPRLETPGWARWLNSLKATVEPQVDAEGAEVSQDTKQEFSLRRGSQDAETGTQ